MEIVKLDGFTADGYGNVIGTEQDLVDGDVCRVDDRIERRFYASVPSSAEDAAVEVMQPTKAELMQKVQELIDAVEALKE